MGQVEVYELLKEKRINGDQRFFSRKNIENMMKLKGYSNGMIENVRRNVISLEASGYLEIKMSGDFKDWRRLFRLKDKYIGD